jgi:hypothetical protein
MVFFIGDTRDWGAEDFCRDYRTFSDGKLVASTH